MTLRSGTSLGHYRIVAALGAGGMGEVYRARDLTLGRDVAIKVLPASRASDSDRLKRFLREAQVLASLNHPHIGAIFGLDSATVDGTDAPIPFLALELVEGQTLASMLGAATHNGQGLPLVDAVAIARQVADAVCAAHDKGIVHRDLKPDNVMVRPDGFVKVLDFGLAKLMEAEAADDHTALETAVGQQTLPGVVMGTARYMSPEQARGEDVDARTDVFALGIMLYEMVAGRPPFGGKTNLEAISEILKTDPPPLGQVAPHAPPELQRIVMKALRKDRGQRYQSMKELSLDLQAQLTAHKGPVSPAPVGAAPSVTPRPATIDRRAWLGVAVVLVLMIGGAAVWLTRGASAGRQLESVAVLPLVNDTNDESVEYLSDGVTESLINSLSQIPRLKVMSRSSVFRIKGEDRDAKDVGSLLGVKGVITGRLARRNGTYAISLELADASDNTQIWGRQYSGSLADIFTLQERIARDLSDQLKVRLTGEELQQVTRPSTQSLKAFEYYMLSRAHAHRRTQQDLLEAVRYCEMAIAEDERYALAYAGLSDAYASLGIRAYLPPAEGRRRSAEAAAHALALDEKLAEAHVAVSQSAVLFAPYDFATAERELRRAVVLNPSLAMAHNYLGISHARQGRFAEATAEWALARELDPLSPIMARAASIPLLLKRDFVGARDVLRRADDLGPQFIIPIEIGVYVENKMFDEALAGLANAQRDRPDDPMLLFQTGQVYAAQGRSRDAAAVIAALEVRSGDSLSQAHWIAKIYSTLGDREQALSWLDRGLTAGAIGDFYRDEPVWDALRADPRFQALERRIDGGSGSAGQGGASTR